MSIEPTDRAVAMARNLFARPSKSEQRLRRWMAAQPALRVFAFQRPAGPYVADFFSESHRLLVEVDGPHHAKTAAHDARRDAFFLQNGYRTLRVASARVWDDVDGVLREIASALGIELGDVSLPETKRVRARRERSGRPARTTKATKTEKSVARLRSLLRKKRKKWNRRTSMP